eukprot:g15848.t1
MPPPNYNSAPPGEVPELRTPPTTRHVQPSTPPRPARQTQKLDANRIQTLNAGLHGMRDNLSVLAGSKTNQQVMEERKKRKSAAQQQATQQQHLLTPSRLHVREEVILTVRVDGCLLSSSSHGAPDAKEQKLSHTFFRNLPKFYSSEKDLLLQMDSFCRKYDIANDYGGGGKMDESKWLLKPEDLWLVEEGEEVRLVSGTGFVSTCLEKIELGLMGSYASSPGLTVEELLDGVGEREQEDHDRENRDEFLVEDEDVSGWLDCICRNSAVPGPLGEWFAETVIVQKGLTVLLDGFLELHNRAEHVGQNYVELCGSILAAFYGSIAFRERFFEMIRKQGRLESSASARLWWAVLLPFDQAISYIADEYILDAEFFEALLATLFGRIRTDMFRYEAFADKYKESNNSKKYEENVPGGRNPFECNFSMSARRSALTIIGLLLNTSLGKMAAEKCHAAALRPLPADVRLKCIAREPPGVLAPTSTSSGATTTTINYYHLMVDAAHNLLDPAHTLSTLLFSFLSQHLSDSEHQITRELSLVAGSDLLLRQQDLDSIRKQEFLNQVLLLNLLDANTEMELQNYQQRCKMEQNEINLLKQQLKRIETRRRKLENDLRHYHLVMVKMVELIVLEHSHVYESLKAIVKFGWDSMKWRRGYTVLHFVAECLDDARIVELFALLATDMNSRDSSGKRALDYARKERMSENVRVLEKVRKQKFVEERTQKFLLEKENFLENGLQSEELPDNLTPILHDGIETILKLGWEQVRWPNEFTILHLACQSGSLPAVRFLLEKVPGVASYYAKVDNHNQRPIDYAMVEGHGEVVDYLSNFVLRMMEMKTGSSKENFEVKPRCENRPGAMLERKGTGNLFLQLQSPRENRQPGAAAGVGAGGGAAGALPAAGDQGVVGTEQQNRAAVPGGRIKNIHQGIFRSQTLGTLEERTQRVAFDLPPGGAVSGPVALTKFAMVGFDEDPGTEGDLLKADGAQSDPDSVTAAAGEHRSDRELQFEAASSLRQLSMQLAATRTEQERLQRENEKLSARLKQSAQGQLGAKVEFLQRVLEAPLAVSSSSEQSDNLGPLGLSEVEEFAAIYEKVGSAQTRREILEQEAELRKSALQRTQALEQRNAAILSGDMGGSQDEEDERGRGAATTAESGSSLGQAHQASSTADAKYLRRALQFLRDSTSEEFANLCLEQVTFFLRCKSMHKDRLAGGSGHHQNLHLNRTNLNHSHLREQLRSDFVAAREDLRTKGLRPMLRGRMVREVACRMMVDSTTLGSALPVLPPEVAERLSGAPADPTNRALVVPESKDDINSGILRASEGGSAGGKKGPQMNKGPPVPGSGAGKGGAPPVAKGAPVPGGKGAPPVPGGAGKGRAAAAPPAKGAAPLVKGAAPPEKGAAPPAKGGAAPTKGAAAPAKGGAAAPAKGGGATATPAKGGAKGGGKGKGKKVQGFDPNSSREYITPKEAMRALWWTKKLKRQLEQCGEHHVWTKVPDVYKEFFLKEAVIEEIFVKRFGRKKTGGPGGGGPAGAGSKEKEKDRPKLKLLTIIDDPMKQGGLNAACKTLPEPTKIQRAILDLDDVEIDVNTLEWVRRDLCPDPGQLSQLNTLRNENKGVPFAIPETYMLAIAHQRLDCWLFARTYEERLKKCMTAYLAFQKVMQSLRNSVQFRKILGLILCAGNYLNGGTDRGQAEGVDLDVLTKLDAVKDAEGKILAFWVMQQFFAHPFFTRQLGPNGEDPREQLFDELKPLFSAVRRRIDKTSDGVETLSKQVSVSIEDYDQIAEQIRLECEQRHEMLRACLCLRVEKIQFEDPCDSFRTVLSPAFLTAETQVEQLIKKKKEVKQEYEDLLKYFTMGTVKAAQLILMVDDVLIPGDLIVNKDQKMKKAYYVPHFCGNRTPTADAVMALWDLKEPELRSLETREKGEKKGRSVTGARKTENRRGIRGKAVGGGGTASVTSGDGAAGSKASVVEGGKVDGKSSTNKEGGAATSSADAIEASSKQVANNRTDGNSKYEKEEEPLSGAKKSDTPSVATAKEAGDQDVETAAGTRGSDDTPTATSPTPAVTLRPIVNSVNSVPASMRRGSALLGACAADPRANFRNKGSKIVVSGEDSKIDEAPHEK